MPKDSMLSRDRIIAASRGLPVDRLPFIIRWGPWGETVRRWKEEGMQCDGDWHSLFGFDPYLLDLPVATGPWPLVEEEVIADEGETVIHRDKHGVLKRDRKDGCSMPEFLEYPVKDRATWEAHKWRFAAGAPGRFPSDWQTKLAKAREYEGLVSIGLYPYGFFGGPRTLMGDEECLIACALDPELIEDINATLAELWLRIVDRVLDEVRLDALFFWEDMAGRQGSLISPAMFRRFMTPHFLRIVERAKARGVQLFAVDSDGMMHELTGLFVEAGVTCIYPYEVQAGNDVPLLLERHPLLSAWGGMDKRCMARDRRAMDAEIERVADLCRHKRYIPFPDHLIPPDVPWKNYEYFVRRWKEMIGKAL